MTAKRKNYKGLVVILAFILIALFIYVSRNPVDDDKERKEKESENRRLIDSLGKVNDELVQIIAIQKRREEEAYMKFKRETEKMRKEYDEKVRNLSNLNTDDHVRFLSEELSKED